ncbi:(d)CMP kinase [Candidatus Microgenomates bacterium]|nr:(d)CMP kinase [Candidatus Microgenomates bacterium]
MPNKFTIAIDGPVGSGKGTLGIALARKLKAIYLYTGGMYRALTLAALKEKIDFRDEKEVLNLLKRIDINLSISSEGTKVFLGKELVNDRLFLPEVTSAVPIIAAMPQVRKKMVARQKKMIQDQSAVIEGRDVATDIAPHADLKIFLTAELEVRARRRHQQHLKKGINKTLEETLADTKERDRQDTERTASPLIIAKDAFVVDTTYDTVEDTVEKVMVKIKELGLA